MNVSKVLNIQLNSTVMDGVQLLNDENTLSDKMVKNKLKDRRKINKQNQ